jgi:hypothetical protein
VPPAGEEAGARGGAGAAEAAEDLEKQILWEGADEVGSSATTACSLLHENPQRARLQN